MELLVPPVEERYASAAEETWFAECTIPLSRNELLLEWSRAIAVCDTDLVYLYLREPPSHSYGDSFVSTSNLWGRHTPRLRALGARWFSEESESTRTLCEEFHELSSMWRRETGHLSSVERKVLHHAYQRIIGMGRAAVPLVLQELRARGGLWFWALHHMTGEDPAERSTTIAETRSAWLAWGCRKGYLSKDE